MSKNLEDFARYNREEFDSESPAPDLWNKIQDRITPATNKAKVVKIQWLKWSVAAAIISLIAISVFYFYNSRNTGSESGNYSAEKLNPASDSILINEINPVYAKELYHFTQLIELKQEELKQIEKENPSLYKQFLTDINSLDSSYNQLKQELPNNPNREQLLEAMISNLQIQMKMLNQQLQIIQQIKQSKNSNDEGNSKHT